VDFQAGVNPRAIAAGDLDGDGKPDLAVANRDNGNITVFRNNSSPGIISLAPKIDYAADVTPCDIAIGDLDGDGKPDLAAANLYTGTISVYKNMSTPGSVSFSTKIDYGTTLNGPAGIAIGDLDGDGKPDLTSVNSSSTVVSVLKNKVNDPIPVITANATTFCSGNYIILNSSTTTNQWYKDGVPINGATDNTLQVFTSGTYTATSTVGGIVSAPSNAITITVIATPTKPTITFDAVKGLVSASATGNQWYDNNFIAIPGANGQSYKPTASGGYYLMVSQNGCSSVFSDEFVFVITATINLGGNGKYLRIAPNPVRNFVQLTFNFPGVNNVGVVLTDVNGRVLQIQGSLSSGNIINTSGLSAGTYFLKFQSSNGKINVTTSIIKL
jgi:hypothetical protein